MQVNEVAAILKYPLRPTNLSAIQNMDENKRDDYDIDRLVLAPQALSEKEMHPSANTPDNNSLVVVALSEKASGPTMQLQPCPKTAITTT